MEDWPPVERLGIEAALNAIGEVLAETHRANLGTQEQLGRYLEARIPDEALIAELQVLDRHAQILADLSRTCQIIAGRMSSETPLSQLDLTKDVELDATRRALITAHSGTAPPQGAGEVLLF